MTTNPRRLFTIAAALLFMSIGAVVANAQYYTAYYSPYTSYYTPYTSYYTPYTSYYTPYTSYYTPTTSYYAPAYTTAYYGGGWYPGRFLDRVRTRLYGSTGYVAAYPATYSAGYAPAYAASYAPSSCPSCQANYMSSYAPSCPTCSSCSTCTASYAPACPCETCGSACQSCSGCSSCSAQAPVQAGYAPEQPTGCSSCGTNQQSNYAPQGAYASQPSGAGTVIATPGATVVQQNAAPASTTTEQRPNLEGNQTVPQSTYRKVPTEATPPQSTPTPEPKSEDPYKVPSATKTSDSSTYLEAPKLWDPRDRTAQRSIAPVHTALYTQPASFRPVSTTVKRGPLTAKQVEENARGWTSASN